MTAEIAQRYLAEGRGACERLLASGDDEALHDFRVALRQLRSTIKAYPDCLGQIDDNSKRKLKQAARATNEARDTEVQLGYLREWMAALGDRELPGAQWLMRQLQQREQTACVQSHDILRARFPVLDKRLSRQLESVPEYPEASAFGPRLAQELATAGEDFRRRLECLTDHEDDASLHAARIAGKRLRYLIAPLDEGIDRVVPLMSALKAIQDLLGEYHDMMVFEDTLFEHAGVAATRCAQQQLTWIAEHRAAPPPEQDLMPGIYRLGEIMAQRKQKLAQQIHDDAAGGQHEDLFAHLDDLIRSVSVPPGQH